MGIGDGQQTVAGEGRTVRRALQYLGRTALLRCPVCGTKPIFKRARSVRNFYDWFTPLDGCPRCGYPYEREPGYFLLAIFGFNFGFGVVLGVGSFIALAATDHINQPVWWLMLTTVLPIPIINLLIARHAKALFIALDHFVDPFVRANEGDGDDDDDDGSSRLIPERPTGGGGVLPPKEDAVEEQGVLVGAGR